MLIGYFDLSNFASSLMKTILRNVISRIPGVRYWVARWLFFRPENHHNVYRFLGVFKTRAEAKSKIPPDWNEGLDDPVPEGFDPNIPTRDANVVRILSEIMPEVKTIFDLGGRVGECFYRYRTKIPYPPDLRWTICDLPEVTEAGRRIAQRMGETQIFFTEDQLEGTGADVYLTCGTLQFFEEPFGVMLKRLKELPQRLLINRVPLTEGEDFFTLQHTTGHSIVPYHIRNIDEFIADVEAVGYKLVEKWTVNRSCDILLRPDHFVKNYHGAYFTLKR